ncbi:hypothetical protein GCM10027346_25440 [Hymenobacter seoulensis]
MQKLTNYLYLLDTKPGKAVLIAVSAYFIFRFGMSVGEFAYHLQH